MQDKNRWCLLPTFDKRFATHQCWDSLVGKSTKPDRQILAPPARICNFFLYAIDTVEAIRNCWILRLSCNPDSATILLNTPLWYWYYFFGEYICHDLPANQAAGRKMVPNKPEPPPPQAGLPTTPLPEPLKWLPTSPASQMGQSQSQIGRPLPNLRSTPTLQARPVVPKTIKVWWWRRLFGCHKFLGCFFIFIILCWENHTILIGAGHNNGWGINTIICMLEGKGRCVLSRIGLCKCGQCPCLLPPRGMHCLKPPSGATHLQYLHTQKEARI